MTDNSDEATIRMSTDHRQKKNKKKNRTNIAEQEPRQVCIGFGSYQHGTPRTSASYLMCPAWGQTCNVYGKPNHFLTVCRTKREDQQSVIKSFEGEEALMDTLIGHITFDQIRGTFMSTNGDQITEINASVIPFSPKLDPSRAVNIPRSRSTSLKVFPDIGATICLGRPKHLLCMGLTKNNLVPFRKIIRTVGGFTLMCQCWLPFEFVVRGKTNKQTLFICKDIQRLYFSRTACIYLCLLRGLENFHAVFPHQEVGLKHNKCEDQLPNRPPNPPFPATEENIGKLKSWVLEKFAKMTFNKDGLFPAMSGPAAHIHLKEGAVPKARHNLIPVPSHLKEPVRQALWKYVERGIIAPVPVGMPTDWCSTKAITAKKNGNPWRTVDYQHLNSQCKRETHHTGSPFQLAL